MTPQSAPENVLPKLAAGRKFLWFNRKALLWWVVAWASAYVALATWGYLHDSAPTGSPMSEDVGPDEEFWTTQIIQSAVETSVQARAQLIESSKDSGGDPPKSAVLPGASIYRYTRDAHAKGHGCVLATFKVNDHVEPQFQYGVFKTPGAAFQAIIRFSNGSQSIQADSARDPRGMAIKLRDVPSDVYGPKLLSGEQNDTTQDFILMNNPVFFIRTLAEYAELNHKVTMVRPGIWPITRVYFLESSFNPLHWHLREFKLALGSIKGMPDSLVTERYWSASAYALGPKQFIKFSTIPCGDNRKIDVPGKGTDDPDYLRRELSLHSAAGKGCFDFAVQPQVLGKNMPVEDTTVEWQESDSPFTPLARIQIQQADNTSAQMYEQCENTAFNPWHSVADHRPAGVMNRVRKSLYAAMSRFRQDQNCKDSCDTKCNSQNWPDSGCAGATRPQPQP
jgi:hypothetical protein